MEYQSPQIDNIDELDDPVQEMYEHFSFTVEKGQSQLRIDKFLVPRMEYVSRNRIQQAAEANCILVNGTPVKSSYKVKPNDAISIVMDRPPYENEIIPEDIPLDIVYEDNDLLLINKPAGLVVHPGRGNYTGTMVNALAYYLRDSKDFDVEDPRLGLVHRIDKETSGLLVVAKTPQAKTHLSKQFADKTADRQYTAIVWGALSADSGRIEGNIGRNPKDRLQMTVLSDPEEGKPAVTNYKVVERLTYVTVIECKLETGRTHQIRVHMKHIGHTLFNDSRYGGNIPLKGLPTAKYKQYIKNCFEICPRQALHAQTLGFTHPTTGQRMNFTSEIPSDITALIDKWRTYSASQM